MSAESRVSASAGTYRAPWPGPWPARCPCPGLAATLPVPWVVRKKRANAPDMADIPPLSRSSTIGSRLCSKHRVLLPHESKQALQWRRQQQMQLQAMKAAASGEGSRKR